MKAENLFGKTYGEISCIVKSNMLRKGYRVDNIDDQTMEELTRKYAFTYESKERERRR